MNEERMMSRAVSRAMIKELGKLKMSEDEREYRKRVRRCDRAAKYHKTERQIVLWPYWKMVLVKLLVPWKWRLAYWPATKSKATGAQWTLTEKGKGALKRNGKLYREVLHRGESRVLSLEKGYLVCAHLMGKGYDK